MNEFKREKKNNTSSATGWSVNERIQVNPFIDEKTSVKYAARDGSATQLPNDTRIETGLTAKEGGTVSAEFTPYQQPDELFIGGQNDIGKALY